MSDIDVNVDEQEKMDPEDLEECDVYPLPDWWDDDSIDLVPKKKREK